MAVFEGMGIQGSSGTTAFIPAIAEGAFEGYRWIEEERRAGGEAIGKSVVAVFGILHSPESAVQ